MALTTEQQILIEQRVTNEAKSTGVAYILWLLFGTIGAHRFYLGRIGSAFTMIALLVLGFIFLSSGPGAFLIIALALWLLVDAFLIPGYISDDKQEIRSALGRQLQQENERRGVSGILRP